MKRYLSGILLPLLFAACNNNDVSKFQKELATQTDTLEYSNRNDTLIQGAKGTAIFFEKESFVLPDGNLPKGSVTVLLKECYSFSDMIRENLSTTSGKNILATRGMIYINAFADDQELQLKPGKKYIIHFPKDSIGSQQQMNLFYGKKQDEKVDWSLDSNTLLRPTAFMSGWMTTGYPNADTTKEPGFYFKEKSYEDIYSYFYKHFDNTKLQPTKDISGKQFSADFIVTKTGNISNLRIVEERLDSSGQSLVENKTKADPYLYQYILQLPTLEPFYEFDGDKPEPIDAHCSFYINIGLYPPAYRNNETYSRLFNQKYAAFKNKTIRTMNDAEMNYYIFSASKLGWINCDFFWQTNDAKINYIVKVDHGTKPNINLIFKEQKSIINGTLVGDKCIFSNIPANQQVRVVSVLFQNGHPQLAVKETTTIEKELEHLEYKDFSVEELEKEVNTAGVMK